MLVGQRRDRLVGAVFMGLIWTTLSTPIMCGLNPVGGFIHDLGTAGLGFIVLAFLLWSALFYGILAVWSWKHR